MMKALPPKVLTADFRRWGLAPGILDTTGEP